MRVAIWNCGKAKEFGCAGRCESKGGTFPCGQFVLETSFNRNELESLAENFRQEGIFEVTILEKDCFFWSGKVKEAILLLNPKKGKEGVCKSKL